MALRVAEVRFVGEKLREKQSIRFWRNRNVRPKETKRVNRKNRENEKNGMEAAGSS